MDSSHRHDVPLYNSRIVDTYVKMIQQRYGHIDVPALLAHAGIKTYEVADQGHWFTQEQVDRLYEEMVKLTGNDRIAREAGQYAASPEALGAIRQYALALVGPANAFRLIKKFSDNLTRSSVYESKAITSNKIEITVTPRDGICEKPFQCENRIGFFEAFVTMFNNKAPKIEHTECIFSGGKACRYIMTWNRTTSHILSKAKDILLLSLILINVITVFFNLSLTLHFIVPVSLILTLSMFILVQLVEKMELQARFNTLRDSSEKAVDQIKANYDNAVLTNEIGQTLSKQVSVNGILHSIIQILQKHLDYDRGMILLSDPQQKKLFFRSGFGYSDQQIELLSKVDFHLDKPGSKGIFVVSFREQRPFLVNDISELERTLSLRSQSLAKKLGTQSFICCPIVYEQESLGILAVENLKTKRPLVQSDMNLLMGVAPMIGISIRNASLIDSREKEFRSLLQIMAASIDARDSLTAGHSEQVTEYALGICDELKLPRDYREMIRVAALLHDYGKIGVPDSILKKEGKLTPEEFEIVKAHATKTREILEQINFEGLLKQVPEVAGAHHEKIDGSGYPKGLKGKEIPLGAKIIAVADFFEAITAKRHYRGPMPVDLALKLLEKESETHFEKKIVNALFSFLAKKNKQPDLQTSQM